MGIGDWGFGPILKIEKMENELDKVKIELINLYLNIKIRTQEEIDSLTEGDIIQEAENIINLPLLDLIQYVKSTIDIIVSTKVESKLMIKKFIKRR